MLPNYHPQAVVEQLLEGAHLSSEDHVAALLRVHPGAHKLLLEP